MCRSKVKERERAREREREKERERIHYALLIHTRIFDALLHLEQS